MSAMNAKVYCDIGFLIQGLPDVGTADVLVEADLSADEFTSGTGAGKVANGFADTRSLAASTSENLDLYGGLTDALGRTVNFAGVKAVLIQADPGNGGNIVVGNAGSHPFLAGLAGTTPTIAIPAGGTLLLTNPAGWAITDSTNDVLKVANSDSGAAGHYTIKIVG